jgi:hypothetical protein
MKETTSLKLGRLLQLVRSIESDLGIGSLSKAEKSLFTSITDLCGNSDTTISLNDILSHQDIKTMPQATIYKCLRELQNKNLIRHEGTRGSGIYRLY